ncbi:MAG TPA: HAMP domain-containing sensor histidine kinase [Ottowia sp.]|uniref:sensor histidine kinase n=1 Tax=Ottowia sp. TaxID=1898956 RepID=UPI002BE428DB|nr:HAMP domain-containing sensor histidine kinase [Ottowia sp.]HNI85389.1 HAMP domain-containing sensor histidine kinase [Ottowia sp.]HNJ44546.1 HAMP domain-containing sensor histidine kinase [Ottowia sp.]HNO41191.1 HAMP domain-containing sensor histidine kinase [Ottowia sp.]HNR82981.1 HAMP domain-containing sensor histidine kinase [Ottowia sp.]
MIPIPAPAPDPASRADWTEARQLAILMDGWPGTQLAVLALWALLGGLLLLHAPGLRTGLWLGAALLVMAPGWRGWRSYRQRLAWAPLAEQRLRLRRQRASWLVQALVWGMAPLCFAQRVAPEVEAMCWALTLGTGVLLVSWSSAHRRLAQGLASVLVAALLASLWLRLSGSPLRADLRGLWWQALLLLVYAAILWRIIGSQHQRVAEGIELSLRNARLIESLREQTRVAQEAARFRTRFLAGAAHDLKQPVNAVGLYADWLSNEPELVDELAPKILQSTLAIHSLFDSLFDWVRLDAGHYELREREVAIRPLLSDLEVQFGPEARLKGLRLRVRPADVVLRTDPVMLRRVIGNLLANAIRYTARGGVLLAARARPDGVSLEVWDTGIGIAQSELEQIFGEFYKVPTSGTEDGFGLGLSIVQALAERLGYRVTVRSRPGRGTVFRVWVPAPAGLRNSAGRACEQSAGSGSGS